jgi:acyl-coenzyme A thioesterase PaaI-like protein
MPVLTALNLAEFIPSLFACDRKRALQVEAVHESGATLRFHASACCSGDGLPLDDGTLLRLVDAALLLALVGSRGASTRTQSTSIRMRMLETPPPGDLIIEARVTCLNGNLGCGEATLRSPDSEHIYAMATGSYRIPGTNRAA